ncbi:MAG: hypothetical protein MJ252_11615 [archaeon]|nr:hypothetical protein [archaeon]
MELDDEACDSPLVKKEITIRPSILQFIFILIITELPFKNKNQYKRRYPSFWKVYAKQNNIFKGDRVNFTQLQLIGKKDNLKLQMIFNILLLDFYIVYIVEKFKKFSFDQFIDEFIKVYISEEDRKYVNRNSFDYFKNIFNYLDKEVKDITTPFKYENYMNEMKKMYGKINFDEDLDLYEITYLKVFLEEKEEREKDPDAYEKKKNTKTYYVTKEDNFIEDEMTVLKLRESYQWFIENSMMYPTKEEVLDNLLSEEINFSPMLKKEDLIELVNLIKQ